MLAIENTFRLAQQELGDLLLGLQRSDESIKVDTWQGQDVRDSAWGTTYELQNAIINVPLSATKRQVQVDTDCNMPWAEEHFLERVSGEPLNPPPSASRWPFTKAGHKAVTDYEHKFSHTYPERFWPKEANARTKAGAAQGSNDPSVSRSINWGLRFKLGDLGDVVTLLTRDPSTRQAYLPVFFPEDTGAVEGQRIPCTLGYHFMIRENRLNITYFIRSCDFLRHFPDDVYLAMRLAQWVKEELNVNLLRDRKYWLGDLTMHMCSLHVFEGDRGIMEHKYGA